MKEGTEYVTLIHSENSKHETKKKTIFFLHDTSYLNFSLLNLKPSTCGSLVYHNHH